MGVELRENWFPRSGNRTSGDKALNALTALVATCAALYGVMFLVVAGLRLTYPFELEWMEGGMVDVVQRILDGKPLYVAPSVDYVPFVYPPLYYYASAAIASLAGNGFTPLRCISLFSTVGSLAILWRLVRRETGSHVYGLMAAGFYAASYRVCGAWFDIGRIDALYLFLMLAAFALLRDHERPGALLGAGVLLAASYLTKQSALVVAAAAAVYCVAGMRGAARWILAASFAAVAALATGLFVLQSGGWYYFYVTALPAQHIVLLDMAKQFFLGDIGGNFAVALAFSAIALFSFRKKGMAKEARYYGCFIGGMTGASFLCRIHRGGYENSLMPAAAAMAVGFALGLNALRRPLAAATEAGVGPGSRVPRNLAMAGILLAVGFQFFTMRYDPALQIPTSADRAAGNHLIATMREARGEVFMPYHGYLPALAGKNVFAHAMAIGDIVDSESDSLRDALLSGIRLAINERRFSMIIADEPFFPADISRNYRYVGPAIPRSDLFWPVTGARHRPEAIFIRKSP